MTRYHFQNGTEDFTRGEYGNRIVGFHYHDEDGEDGRGPCVMDSDFGCMPLTEKWIDGQGPVHAEEDCPGKGQCQAAMVMRTELPPGLHPMPL